MYDCAMYSGCCQAMLGFVPFILAQYRILPQRFSSLGSAIIDPYRRILALEASLTPLQVTLTAEVSTASSATLQGVLGDCVGWISLAGMMAIAIGTPQVLKKTVLKGARAKQAGFSHD